MKRTQHPRLSPVLDLLFCALRNPAPQVELASKSDKLDDEDWRSLADLAIDLHRVGPAVWGSLNASAQDKVPPEVALRFKEAEREAKIHALTAKAETGRIVRAFNAAGLEPYLLKGWALEEELFGRIGQRVTFDIDLMIDECGLRAAMRLLEELGYRCALTKALETERALRSFLRFAHHIVFFRPATQTVLELHVRPFRNWQLLPLADFPTESRSLSIGNGTVVYRVPSLPCNFIYLALHGYQHRWERAKWLIDIPPLLNRLSDSDWRWIYGTAQHLAVDRTIGIALVLSRDLLGAVIPGPAEALLDKADGSYLASACRRELLATEPYSDGPKLNRWLESHVISLRASSRFAVLRAALQILMVRESDVLTSDLADRYRILQYLFAVLHIPKRMGQRIWRRVIRRSV